MIGGTDYEQDNSRRRLLWLLARGCAVDAARWAWRSSGLARAGGHARMLREWSRSAGVIPALSWEWHRLRVRLGARRDEWIVRPRQVEHPLAVRLVDSEDANIWRQIFVLDEARHLGTFTDVRTVIDLGANAGYVSAFLLSEYPGSRVLAVELDAANVAHARRNLAPYGDRVEVLHGAAWSSNSLVSVAPGDGDWGRQARVGGDGPTVPSYDMPTLIERIGGQVDLLKVDIEGAEEEIFRANTEWLDRVRNMSIELHTPGAERAFRHAMKPYAFEERENGSTLVLRDIRRRDCPKPKRRADDTYTQRSLEAENKNAIAVAVAILGVLAACVAVAWKLY